jgi:hypothetical protein
MRWWGVSLGSWGIATWHVVHWWKSVCWSCKWDSLFENFGKVDWPIAPMIYWYITGLLSNCVVKGFEGLWCRSHRHNVQQSWISVGVKIKDFLLSKFEDRGVTPPQSFENGFLEKFISSHPSSKGGILPSLGMYGDVVHAQPLLGWSSSHSLRMLSQVFRVDKWDSLRMGRTSTQKWLYMRHLTIHSITFGECHPW